MYIYIYIYTRGRLCRYPATPRGLAARSRRGPLRIFYHRYIWELIIWPTGLIALGSGRIWVPVVLVKLWNHYRRSSRAIFFRRDLDWSFDPRQLVLENGWLQPPKGFILPGLSWNVVVASSFSSKSYSHAAWRSFSQGNLDTFFAWIMLWLENGALEPPRCLVL